MKIETHQEVRWVLAEKFGQTWYLLGPYCWDDGSIDKGQGKLATFETRKLAREARGTCCYPNAKPMKVRITIEAFK